jgi:hypothetical protein
MAREENNCDRCGAEGMYFFDSYMVTMSDVYIAHLCADCRNDWDVYIFDQPARAARIKNADAMNMAFSMTCGDGVDRSEQIASLRTEWDQLSQQVREIAIAWVAQPIARNR